VNPWFLAAIVIVLWVLAVLAVVAFVHHGARRPPRPK
jgi:hypothetical protein